MHVAVAKVGMETADERFIFFPKFWEIIKVVCVRGSGDEGLVRGAGAWSCVAHLCCFCKD